jgi:hypothetical protein
MVSLYLYPSKWGSLEGAFDLKHFDMERGFLSVFVPLIVFGEVLGM